MHMSGLMWHVTLVPVFTVTRSSQCAQALLMWFSLTGWDREISNGLTLTLCSKYIYILEILEILQSKIHIVKVLEGLQTELLFLTYWFSQDLLAQVPPEHQACFGCGTSIHTVVHIQVTRRTSAKPGLIKPEAGALGAETVLALGLCC